MRQEFLELLEAVLAEGQRQVGVHQVAVGEGRHDLAVLVADDRLGEFLGRVEDLAVDDVVVNVQRDAVLVGQVDVLADAVEGHRAGLVVALPVVGRVDVEAVPGEVAVEFHPADAAGRAAGHALLGQGLVSQPAVPGGGDRVDAFLAADLRVRLEPGAVAVGVPAEGIAPLAVVRADQQAEAGLLALAQREVVVDDLEVRPLLDRVLRDRVEQEQAVLAGIVHEADADVGDIRRHGVGQAVAAFEERDQRDRRGAVLGLDGPTVGQAVPDLERLFPAQPHDGVAHRGPQVRVGHRHQPGEADLAVRAAGLADIGIQLKTRRIDLILYTDDEAGPVELLVEDEPRAGLAVLPLHKIGDRGGMEIIEGLAARACP